MSTSQSVAKVSKKSGSKGSEGVSKCEYSSPGNSSCSLVGNEELADDPVPGTLVVAAFKSEGSLVCIGSPISVAELALRPLVPDACVARLNICGIRARDNEEEEDEPSGGCIC